MNDIAGYSSKNKIRAAMDPLSSIKKTLREHYSARQKYYDLGEDLPIDKDLLKAFSPAEPGKKKRPTVAGLLHRNRRELASEVSHWTGKPAYSVSQLINDCIIKSQALKLRISGSENEAKQKATLLLAVLMLRLGRFRVFL